jgi:hypothetical protein
LEIGRWIAVIPGGILFGFLVLFPLHWILYFTLVRGSMIEMPMEDMAPIEKFISPILSSIIFVYSGAKIVPKKKFIVAIILFIIGILFRIGLMLFLVAMPDMGPDLSFYGLSRLILSGLAGGIGAFFIYWSVKKAEIT